MDVRIIGVVGAGAMGAGIAQIAAAAGYQVKLFDVLEGAASKACAEIAGRLDRLVEKGSLDEGAARAAKAQLQGVASLAALRDCDLIVEAIVERLDVKQALFRDLEAIASERAILATNTSSLSVAAIARVCQHRARVCGLHFFNPVPVMKLVEIIAAPATSPDVMDAMRVFCARVKKTAVETRDTPGFLVNLAGRAYVTEAQHIALEGVASYAVIDTIMKEAAGFRMGPFELMDLTGIDVNFPAAMSIWQGFQADPRLKPTVLQEGLFNAGQLGRKTGRGFHVYDTQANASAPNPEAAAPPGQTLRAWAPECRERFARIEGVTLTASDEGGAILVAPYGEDASAVAVRLGLDAARVVAIDLLAESRRFLTLMSPIGGDDARERAAQALSGHGWRVVQIGDCPGFVAPRMLAMIANLGCEIAQMGIAAPHDIDVAMKLAQNYPQGPLEWAQTLGPDTVLRILSEMQALTGSDRYRPSPWLRRRAQLGLAIHTPDRAQ